MQSVPPEIQYALEETVGNGILSTMSTVRTLYVDQNEEYSGTALLLSNADLTLCLTANHVVTPTARTPPVTKKVVQHFYAENLVKGKGLSKTFMLRGRFYREERNDLALLVSSVSGYGSGHFRRDYYRYSDLKRVGNMNICAEDILVTCGFPGAMSTYLSATRTMNHELALRFFSGAEGSNDPNDEARYFLQFNGDTPPWGMSGSPIWLIRDRNNPLVPLTFDMIKAHSGQELHLQTFFYGLVVEHYPLKQKLAAVRPELCAAFARKAEARIPELRTSDEDAIIDEQMTHWLEMVDRKVAS